MINIRVILFEIHVEILSFLHFTYLNNEGMTDFKCPRFHLNQGSQSESKISLDMI